MRPVFADSLYWIAIARPGDPWVSAARKAKAELGDVRIITTDEVLAEFLTALSGGGPKLRRQAASIVREIISNPMVKVIPQSRDSFLGGLKFYELRRDKEYSLIDCLKVRTASGKRSHAGDLQRKAKSHGVIPPAAGNRMVV